MCDFSFAMGTIKHYPFASVQEVEKLWDVLNQGLSDYVACPQIFSYPNQMIQVCHSIAEMMGKIYK